MLRARPPRRALCAAADGAAALLRGLEEELRAQKPIQPLELDALRERGWRWEQSARSPRIVAQRWHRDARLQIAFYAQSRSFAARGAPVEPARRGVSFLLMVDANRPGVVVAEGRAADTHFFLYNLYVIDRRAVGRYFDSPHLLRTRGVYSGPDFAGMSKVLEGRVRAFLTEIGCDDQLAGFLEGEGYLHEVVMYRQWLEDFKAFLQ